jgi:mannose-6-phosphate isomerase-like protein (cupin superfamily)
MVKMKIILVKDEPNRANPHGVEVRKLYDNEHAQVVHIRLRPGEALKKHVTPVDVFFYILEGEGDVEIGDEVIRAGKDCLVDSPANIPHRLMNPTDVDFRFLVVKVPRPKEKSVMAQGESRT